RFGSGENAYVRTLRENTVGSNLTAASKAIASVKSVRVFYIIIFVVRSFWSEHSSILEQRLELETSDRDRCAVVLVLKSLSTVEIGVEEEENCLGLTSRYKRVTLSYFRIRHSVFYNENVHTDRRGNKEGICCTRTGRKAKLAILKVKDKNKYIVVGFNEVHNHDLTTVDKVHLLRSHRNLTESTKVYSADMSKVNIPVYKQLSLLEVQVGGLENVGFVKRDVYNYLREVREEVIGHDAELLKEHFMAEQETNESFYFKMEVDSEGRMGNIFWSDAKSRRAYGFFWRCGGI
ncbi:unnamed protein product, partial [Prunus brigantina]